MGARLAKTFPHPEPVLSFCVVNSQQHWPEWQQQQQKKRKEKKRQRQQKHRSASWSILADLLSDHTIACRPSGGSTVTPTPKILSRRALFFSPATKTRPREASAILFCRGPTARFCSQPPTCLGGKSLVVLLPTRRFSLSRRPFITIAQPPPISRANGSDSRASKLNPSLLHPHPSIRLQLQGVKFNSPTNLALSVSAPASKAFQLQRTQNYRLCRRTLFLDTEKYI